LSFSKSIGQIFSIPIGLDFDLLTYKYPQEIEIKIDFD
jgi:hypothetical protein